MKNPDTQTTQNSSDVDQIHEQAWEWLRLFHMGNVKSHQAEQFKHWLAQDARHGTVFKQARQQWSVIGAASEKILHELPDLRQAGKSAVPKRSLSRRIFLGTATGAAVAIGTSVFYSPASWLFRPNEWNADYRTAIGEQREIKLANDVAVILNTQTSIRKQPSDVSDSGVDLLSGEAAFDLTGDNRVPFVVQAGVGKSAATTGSFEVRYLDDKVFVTCIQGTVKVMHPAGQCELQAQQQTVYDRVALGNVAKIDIAKRSDWRQGELVFTQARLGDVLAEINRYRPGRVVLMNANASEKRVTGNFQIASLELALAQLQHTFDLNSQSLPGGLIVLS
jgi:transmembrane sensor